MVQILGSLGERLYNAVGNTASSLAGSITDNQANAETNPWISNMNDGKYNFQLLKFPESLDDPQKSYYGHSMMININVPNYSLYEQTFLDGRPTSIYNGLPHQTQQAGVTRNYTVNQNQYSRMDTLRRLYDSRYSGQNMQNGTRGPLANQLDIGGITTVAHRTRRIREAILLFMPSTAAFVQTNTYQDFSLTELLGKVGVGAAQGAMNALQHNPGMSAAVGAARAAGATIAGAAAAVSALNNTPINPRVEVIYGSPTVRTFEFNFDMAPSNERESILIDNIIKTLRFHAAPELSNYLLTVGNFQNPFFMTPPAEFDITFFHNGEENTKIPRINTCVLERIDVNYSPTDVYSTFSNGYPISVRLNLVFKEIEVLHKLRILEGF